MTIPGWSSPRRSVSKSKIWTNGVLNSNDIVDSHLVSNINLKEKIQRTNPQVNSDGQTEARDENPSKRPSYAQVQLKITGHADNIMKGLDIQPSEKRDSDDIIDGQNRESIPVNEQVKDPAHKRRSSYAQIQLKKTENVESEIKGVEINKKTEKGGTLSYVEPNSVTDLIDHLPPKPPVYARAHLKKTGHADSVMNSADLPKPDKPREESNPQAAKYEADLDENRRRLKKAASTSILGGSLSLNNESSPWADVNLTSTKHGDFVKKGADPVKLVKTKEESDPEAAKYEADLEATRKLLKKTTSCTLDSKGVITNERVSLLWSISNLNRTGQCDMCTVGADSTTTNTERIMKAESTSVSEEKDEILPDTTENSKNLPWANLSLHLTGQGDVLMKGADLPRPSREESDAQAAKYKADLGANRRRLKKAVSVSIINLEHKSSPWAGVNLTSTEHGDFVKKGADPIKPVKTKEESDPEAAKYEADLEANRKLLKKATQSKLDSKAVTTNEKNPLLWATSILNQTGQGDMVMAGADPTKPDKTKEESNPEAAKYEASLEAHRKSLKQSTVENMVRDLPE